MEVAGDLNFHFLNPVLWLIRRTPVRASDSICAGRFKRKDAAEKLGPRWEHSRANSAAFALFCCAVSRTRPCSSRRELLKTLDFG